MKNNIHSFAMALAAAFLWVVLPAANSADFRFEHEHVLGTSLELRVNAPSASVASRVEASVLAEIDRLTAILSRHDSHSELMRWQISNSQDAVPLSPELCDVLRRAEYWRLATQGAFDVRAAGLGATLQSGDATSSDDARHALCAQLTKSPYRFMDECSPLKEDALPISLDGLAKGYILDAVCRHIQAEFPEVVDLSLNIGGDLRKVGVSPQAIAIVNPADPGLNSQPLVTFVASRPLAMATSGGYFRYQEVSGLRHSHIIDPRTGLSASRVSSATVVADNAMDADALATALCVLDPQEGMHCLASIPSAECLLVLADGQLCMSPGWLAMTSVLQDSPVKAKADPPAAKKPASPTGLIVNFTLSNSSGGRYRRPYVAIWLEDKDGFPVKTAVLWLQTSQPGPRWHRELTRWYRNDRLRQLVDDSDLIASISSATRGGGEYQTRFDGADDAGKPLPDGAYTLCLEVAREHGTYQIIREPIAWKAGQAIPKKDLKGNAEMSAASYEFVPPTDAVKR